MQITRPPSVRAFVAVDPDDAARVALGAASREIGLRARARGWTIRVVSVESLHFTLKFLGQIETARVDEFLASMRSELAADSFEICIDELGCFPRQPKNPTVLLARVGSGSAELTNLAEQVDRCYSGFGFARETRAFEPHLTLARVKHAANAVGSATDVLDGIRLSEAAGICMRISEVILYRSELSQEGARYTPLGRVVLGPVVSGACRR